VVRTGPEPEPDRGEPFAMVRFEVQAARQNQTTVRFWVHLLLFKNRTEPDHGSTNDDELGAEDGETPDYIGEEDRYDDL
jgi:hypothetical protein